MVSVCFAVITLISFVYAVCAGNTGVLTGAILEGAGAGVRLSLELCGASESARSPQPFPPIC